MEGMVQRGRNEEGVTDARTNEVSTNVKNKYQCKCGTKKVQLHCKIDVHKKAQMDCKYTDEDILRKSVQLVQKTHI